MAIKNTETGEVTYEGRVLSVASSHERVMSDVWTTVYTAYVVELDGSQRSIWLGCSQFPSKLNGNPDITHAWHNLAKAYTEIQLSKNAIDNMIATKEQRIKDVRNAAALKLKAVNNGDMIIVTRKGKDNKVGDYGKVFWRGECRFTGKERYGFKTNDGKTHWVTKDSCQPAKVTAEDILEAKDEAELEFLKEFTKVLSAFQTKLEIAQVNYNFARMGV